VKAVTEGRGATRQTVVVVTEPRTAASPDPRVARTRARVLAAAWEVLAEVGFERVTIELVSERSGVARSTMYRHWQTREEILRDAFAEQRVPSHRDPDAAAGAHRELVTYAVAFASGLAADWGRAAVTMATQALDDPDQRRAVLTFAEGSHADLHRIAELAHDEGALPAGADVAEVAEGLIDAIVAPLFYRYHVLGAPADAAAATALAERAWSALTGSRAAPTGG
jgi:AcrR family transcriptional regulator